MKLGKLTAQKQKLKAEILKAEIGGQKSEVGALLANSEWDFEDVPNGELTACCYWEYARESAFIRDVRRRCMDPRSRMMTNTEVSKFWGDDVQKIQSIGYAAEVFLQGFTLGRASQCQSNDSKTPNCSPSAHPLIAGGFPCAWQTLGAAERKERSHIASDKTTIPLVPFERGPSFFAKWIDEYCQNQRLQAFEQQASVKTKYPDLSEDELLRRGMLKSPEMRQSLYAAGAEIGVFEIQWDVFTNEELRDGFYDWIRENRPAALPAPDGRGRKPGDWRANLTRLAVMRLLSVYTPLEIVDTKQNKFPEVWQTKQFAARKWGDITKWHDARREAERFFRSLFPFLPKGEKPLSWTRQHPVKQACN